MTLRYASRAHPREVGQKGPARTVNEAAPAFIKKEIVPPPIQYVAARAKRHFEEKLVALSRLGLASEAE